MSARAQRTARCSNKDVLIEGYASLFGVEDLSGDVVRAGAFSSRLPHADLPMLLQHRPGAQIGRWVRVLEDGRGLFVRGLIDGKSATWIARTGVDGLSIGFRPQVWTLRPSGGRTLLKIDLVEVSLVAEPMLPTARFTMISGLE